MKIIAAILFKLGLGGASLDRILGLLTKLDRHLEAFEAKQTATTVKHLEQIAKADAAAKDSLALVERAKRVRAKVGELIA